MIKTFRHKGLSELWNDGRTGKIDVRLHKRIALRLNALNAAAAVEDMDVPSFDFHPLRGVPIRFTVHVNGPWCVTFEFGDGDAARVDLEQYHRGLLPMTEYPAFRNPDICPSHPGELLREDVLPATKLSKAEFARRLGISRQHLYDILDSKKPVSASVAVRLGALLGNGAGIWLRMQGAYDVWHAEREVDVSGIRKLEAA